jgi:hypothetical protein
MLRVDFLMEFAEWMHVTGADSATDAGASSNQQSLLRQMGGTSIDSAGGLCAEELLLAAAAILADMDGPQTSEGEHTDHLCCLHHGTVHITSTNL